LLPSDKATELALGQPTQIVALRSGLAFTDKVLHSRFERITIEEEDDWIPCVKNKGQTFDAYVKSKPNQVYQTKQTLYILPLDTSISAGFL